MAFKTTSAAALSLLSALATAAPKPAAKQGLDRQAELVYDRHCIRAKRGENEIGMHSVRGGNIVGEHEVIFAGHDEIVTVSHSARSREVFARGALSAALFMKGKGAGKYDMSAVIDSMIG